MKYLSNFRKVVNRCIKNGWLEKDPFFGFKMTKKEVVPEFLTAHELHALSVKVFTSSRLSLIRDICLFCCYTGLAFVDVRKLETSEIVVGIHTWTRILRPGISLILRLRIHVWEIVGLSLYDAIVKRLKEDGYIK